MSIIQQVAAVDLKSNICSDCHTHGTPWASTSFAVFLCTECAGIHRTLDESSLGAVKSLWNNELTSEENKRLSETYLEHSDSAYEKYVPVWYYRPGPNDGMALKQQWIAAKYLRKEFFNQDTNAKLPYTQQIFSVNLLKKSSKSSKDNKPIYELRRFELNEVTGLLRYYDPSLPVNPKHTGFTLSDVTSYFVAQKMGIENGLQIVLPWEDSIRNLYVYSDNTEDVVNLFQAFRKAKYYIFKSAFPGAEDNELISSLTKPVLCEGYLQKTGGRKTFRESFRKRWFMLESRYLYYFKHALDDFCKGRIFIGPRHCGYHVERATMPERLASKLDGSCFTIRTPSEDFPLIADNERELNKWIDVLNNLLSTDLTMKETARYRSAGENV